MAKVGGQGLGGLLTGVVAHFRPELAETVGSQIDGILHGLTGIASNKALPGGGGTDAGYEDYDGEGASVVGLSDQAYIHIDTLGEDGLPQLELLIGQVARQPDPAMRKWLLASLNETLAGLLAPRTEEQLF